MGFFENLSSIQMFFYILAIFGTFILIIQLLADLLGFQNRDNNVQIEPLKEDEFIEENENPAVTLPLENNSDKINFSMVSVHSILAFLAVLGWTGVALTGKTTLHIALLLTISFVNAVLGAFAVSVLLYGFGRVIQQDNRKIQRLTGGFAETLSYIPKHRNGQGMVQIKGKKAKLFAVTDDDRDIAKDSTVSIIGAQDDVLIVTDVQV